MLRNEGIVMNEVKSKIRKKSDNTQEVGRFVSLFVVILCASIMFTIDCFQVKDFYNSTVEVVATVEQIEKSQDGYFIKMSYDYDGKNFTDIIHYKTSIGYKEGKTKEIRINPNNPELIYIQKAHIRDMYLGAGVFVASSCALIYEITGYVKKKKTT